MPKSMAKMMTGRKLPEASASNGLTKSPFTNAETEPLPVPALLNCPTCIRCRPESSAALLMCGFISIARNTPNTDAASEVKRYQSNTPLPSLPNFFTDRLEAPQTSEKKMIGITIIFNMAMSTVPKGEIHATARCSHSSPIDEPAQESVIPARMPMTNAAPIR